MTGRDWVSASLRKIGALAPGETIAAAEASDGLDEGNRMLGSWSNDGLLIPSINAETPITLIGGQATYTLGASGDITTRPQKIEKAMIRDGLTDYPVQILTLDEYAKISLKSNQSTYPNCLYDDGGYPQRTITLYPVPNAAKQLVLYTVRPLTSIATLDTVVSLPPGYDDALIYNLAVRLAAEYGKMVPDAVAMIANDAMGAIKRANHRPSYLECDDGVIANRSAFNIWTGGFGR